MGRQPRYFIFTRPCPLRLIHSQLPRSSSSLYPSFFISTGRFLPPSSPRASQTRLDPFSSSLTAFPPLPDSDIRYRKGYLDLVFVVYHIVFFSFVRQIITINICHPIARYFGIKRLTTLNRFGEQGYALVYFTIMGAWGYFIVLLLSLEKPRKDYRELVAHHFATLWLIGWSYLVNMTVIGNAVYMSMDIPDAFLAFSKILNYLQFTQAKLVTFIIFLCMWTSVIFLVCLCAVINVLCGRYFRLYLNIVMLWSVWYEFDLIPEATRVWAPQSGVWLVWWMKYQMFGPLLLLLMLNLFWYYFIWRIALRSLQPSTMTDDRSDDEDDGDVDADVDHEKEE
ncbi:longevity assurance proteins LAG1/LAC1 [Butyriboletus roseoflavus]|nr:longevity assurance proteins LAG1/LAC1 [Butyriboletus roseoflavus]